MAKDTRFTMADEQPMPAASNVIAKKDAKTYTAADMRSAFQLGHAYGRAHVYNPQEMNAVMAAEEALANWPD